MCPIDHIDHVYAVCCLCRMLVRLFYCVWLLASARWSATHVCVYVCVCAYYYEYGMDVARRRRDTRINFRHVFLCLFELVILFRRCCAVSVAALFACCMRVCVLLRACWCACASVCVFERVYVIDGRTLIISYFIQHAESQRRWMGRESVQSKIACNMRNVSGLPLASRTINTKNKHTHTQCDSCSQRMRFYGSNFALLINRRSQTERADLLTIIPLPRSPTPTMLGPRANQLPSTK